MKNLLTIKVFLFLYSTCNSLLTVKLVPLHIRQSWLKTTLPILTFCISETRVDPTFAYKSIMQTEVPNDPHLKCFYRCLHTNLNLIEATTGEFIKEEFLRQIEGCTDQIFTECKKQTKDEPDLCKKSFDMYMCLVHALEEPVLIVPAQETDVPQQVSKAKCICH
ncbi:hypothetical protein FQA39_LY06318 [Lamprigera yunnana]|nr:hypothetical protein FQA39_LY06318 [Lamprigera yunnana]